MNKAFSHIFSKVNVSIAITCFLLTSFIGFLLVSNYASLKKLRESSLKQYQFEFQQRALDLSHLLTDHNYNFQDLSNNDQINKYFKNKALGMSMEYGLRSSINAIDNEFEEFIEVSKHGDQTLFPRVIFFDNIGDIISDSGQENSKRGFLHLLWQKTRGQSKGFHICQNQNKIIVGIFYTLPYYFKGTLEGHIILRVNMETLFEGSLNSQSSTLFTGISYPHSRVLTVNEDHQPDESRFVKNFLIAENEVPLLRAQFEKVERTIIFSRDIREEGFKLVDIASSKAVLGGSSPVTLLLALVLTGLIVLIASLLLIQVITRNLTLQARIDEAHKREKAIEQKNLQLQVEIEERKRSEAVRVKLESKLNRVQKMEAIGVLAGGVAHDLNNILSGLVSYPDLLLKKIPHDSDIRKPLTVIQQSGLKAAAIVQDLLTMARRGVASTKVLNLNQIIQEYLKSPEYQKVVELAPNVTMELNLDDKLYNIQGSTVHLSKTIMNLVANSLEAMPQGGLITISTNNITIDQPLEGYEYIIKGSYAFVGVVDKGIGISPEDLEHIFEPFYTKKKMGRSGTGLGMAVVWGTVKDHNGYIEVKSELGVGTAISMYFPTIEMKVESEEKEQDFSTFNGNGESILVVDDVKEQRLIAKDILEQLQYTVKVMSCGEDAVAFLKENSIDLVILDMIMEPGIDGFETYSRILKFHPNQKVLITSGYSESERVKAAQQLGPAKYLSKPYTIEHIASSVRALLSA